MLEPVHVTGTGVISCAGNNPQELWESALTPKSGIQSGLGYVAGENGRSIGGALEFSLEACHQAMTTAGWSEMTPQDGLILATTTGQIPIWDQALIEFLQTKISKEDFEKAFVHQPLGVLLDAVCDKLNHQGKSMLVASACAASTQAIMMAAMWIQQKKVKRCLVVGVEILCTLTMEGFKSLQLLSVQNAKPFDKNRTGINLSEGAAALCLESSAERSLAQISGYGITSDGYHMTGPHPEGRGVAQAIQKALAKANLQPQDISWVHAHGTGSVQNDLAEGLAIENIFGIENAPWVSSTKAIHGHALGASGALEVVLCIEGLKHQMILKTAGLEDHDAKIQVRHASENLPTPIKHILKTTLGFGGVNAALIITQAQGANANH